MYEKASKALFALKHLKHELPLDILDFVVDLVAAARPESEAAEREHCRAVADEMDNGPNVHAAYYFERERAAARVEGP